MCYYKVALTLTVERHMPANALFSSLHLSGNDFFHFSTIHNRSKLPVTKSIQAILANHNRLQKLIWHGPLLFELSLRKMYVANVVALSR